MKEFVGLRAKIYSYLKDDNDEDKEGKNKCAIKKLKFEDYTNCLAQIENKINHLEKNKIHVDTLKKIKKNS